MAISFRLRKVGVSFGPTVALREVELEIGAGEVVALVGPSGAGKTTLLRLLNGAVRPSEGEVAVRGAPLSELSRAELRALRASIGFVHQGLDLVPNLRVSQNVLAGRLGRMGLLRSLRHVAFPRRSDLLDVLAILDRVGIGEKIFERTDRLSGGQRQRVAIARALYQGPEALLADEPVSSVDPARARDTIGLLTDLARERSLTLCMSLHNLELARAFFPRLVGLRGGRVVFDRAAGEVEPEAFRALYDLADEELLADDA